MSQFAPLASNPAGRPARPARSGSAGGVGTSAQARPSGSPGSGAAPRAAASRAGQLTARLRKLAAAGSTGTLPVTGARDGTIHLRAGQVTGAESSRTPGPGPGLAARPLASVPAPADRGQPGSALPDPAMAAALTLLEPAVDAVLDLMLAEVSCGRFRPVKSPTADPPIALPMEPLLAEIARRQQLLRQMANTVTPDTLVTRNPAVLAPRFQITALQWALLIRAGTATTPRDLAFALGRSVFGATSEVYRLMALRLLSGAHGQGQGSENRASTKAPDRGPMTVSFIRALSD
jgi:hypothetical protein